MRFSKISLGVLALAAATPAYAQDSADPPKAITVTGGVTGITDYRFRGLTQTDEKPALQGTLNVNHSSGAYVGTWMSTIDGDGSTPALTGYGGVEVDLYAGYTHTFASGTGIDVGVLYYWYADARKGVNTDFFEPYASITQTAGPVTGKLGIAYSPSGQKGLDFTTGSDDNVYLYGEASVGIPKTPVTLKAHSGYSSGSLGLANPLLRDDDYWDFSLTAEAAFGPIKVGASYVDTDVTNRLGFANTLGRDATVLGYLSFSF